MSDSISPEEAKAAYTEALRRIEEAERTNATELKLFKLPLTELPPEIGRLTQLKNLRVGYIIAKPRITNLPPEIVQLTNLEWLDLSQNNLSGLPSGIGQLTSLRTLDLSQNRLSRLPDEIGRFGIRIFSIRSG